MLSSFRYTMDMNDSIAFELEDDGRWIAEISVLPGVMVYAASREEAGRRSKRWPCVSLPTVSSASTGRPATSALRLHESIAKLEGDPRLSSSPANRLG